MHQCKLGKTAGAGTLKGGAGQTGTKAPCEHGKSGVVAHVGEQAGNQRLATADADAGCKSGNG